MKAAALLALVVAAATARAESRVELRMASVAPDGSSWARELRAFSRRVAAATDGRVQVKWYFNAVAGDELEVGERIKRGELDGAASGQMLCQRVSPTMRLSRIPGFFRAQDEAVEVLNKLQPMIEAEAHRAGFFLPAVVPLGTDVMFMRAPVKDLASLQKTRLWVWDSDVVAAATARAMGLSIVELPINDAARAFDQGRIDGFIAIPSAALVYQWSAQAHYLVDLRPTFITGCVLIAERAYAPLAPDDQAAIRTAIAETRERLYDVTRRTDETLLGGGFGKQGVVRVHVSEQLRAEFFDAAQKARARVAATQVSPDVLNRASALVKEIRARSGR